MNYPFKHWSYMLKTAKSSLSQNAIETTEMLWSWNI